MRIHGEKAMKRLSLLVVAALLAGLPARALAQDYPTRQATIIVPFAPGGSADIVARIYAQKLSERLGKPVVVENRAGAGTVIGASAAARAEPDGYTLFMGGSSALAYNPSLHRKLPYDPAKDFVPLAHVAAIPFVLVVQPSLPVQSLADLIKLAQDKPGHLAFGTAGLGSPAHLCAEYLRSITGIDITYIPYKGSAPALTDFIAGRIPTMFVDLPPALPLIREGKMRALGVSSIAAVPAAPEIKPLAQAGVPGYDAGGWLMFAAPAGTPQEIVDKLHAELKRITATPEIQQRFTEMGLVPIDSPAVEALRRYVVSEIERWGKVIRAAGIPQSD
jgi:tripartite-type tricarboxylate transporter receptor subunit TctC